MRPALALTLVLLLAPLGAAQEHEHGGGRGGAMVLHDGPPSGRAVVGAYTHFGFALLDEEGAPVVHQDAEFSLTQDGRVLFSTTDAHEYDGLFSFDVLFTRPGPYEVVATSGDMPVGRFAGEAVMPANESVATVELVASPRAGASRIVDVEIAIVDAAGALLEHTDAIVEVRAAADGALVSRSHLHIHDEPIRFTQALPAGDHVAQVVGYKAFATGRSADVRAVVAEFPLAGGPVGDVVPPMPELAPPAPLEQRGGTASADGLTLHVMYDPNQQVGLGQLARVAAIVTDDANGTPVQHVDFGMTLAGPRGTTFATQSGHEYDGVFEHLFRPDAPGPYDGALRATFGETELVVPVHLLVVPPVVPLLGGTGPIELGVEGIDGVVAGEETTLTFSAMGPAGPAAHSEVEVTIHHEGEAPLYQFKLHTHDSGLTAATVRFPHEGAWKVRVDPLPTLPDAAIYAPALFELDVAEGGEGILPLGMEGEPAAQVPAAWGALAVLALAGAAALARRLR